MAVNSFKKQRKPAVDRQAAVARQNTSARKKGGATGRKRRLGDLLRGYLHHHSQVFRETFVRLSGVPVQTLMTSLVIAIALGLPAALYVSVGNLQQVGDSVRQSGQLSVFLKRGAKPEAIDDLRKSLATHSDIHGIEYVSPEQALDEFQALSGFGEVLKLLDENPLPALLLVRTVEGADIEQLSALQGRLEAQPLVDDVRVDMEWVQRLQGILEIGRKLALSMGLALSLGVLLIVGNTIRLAIENRRDEIVVVKLVGGTDSYVRRPFLYAGLWYGLLGGVLAWILVTTGLAWLDSSVDRLAALYHSSFDLKGLGIKGLLILLAIGVTLGLVGASIAVGKHIAALEPR